MWWLTGILVIGVLIFVHELGHFLVAKWCGVGVVKFSVGFGPAIIRKQVGETTYQLSVIPLGGFVRMVGDMPDGISGPQETDAAVRNDQAAAPEKVTVQAAGGIPSAEGFHRRADAFRVEHLWNTAEGCVPPERLPEKDLSPQALEMIEDRSRWFIEKSLAVKSAIVFAGPLFNFLFAVIAIAFGVFVYGNQEADPRAIIGEVQKNSPAEEGGLLTGDEIVSINDRKISLWKELQQTIQETRGDELEVSILRDGIATQLNITPEKKSIPGIDHDLFLIGIQPVVIQIDVGIFEASKIGVIGTANLTITVFEQIGMLLSGKASAKDLGGPILIFQAAGHNAKRGFENLLLFTAFLSVSLAVLNLLPIPVLDGGHLLFFLIEALIGPISIRKKEIAQQFGMIVLLSLMLFALHNDIFRDQSVFEDPMQWEDK